MPPTHSTAKLAQTAKPLKLPQHQNVSLEQPQDPKIAHLPASPTVSSSRSSSRSSSARNLDFGGIKGSKSQKFGLEGKFEAHDLSPTWADRVKGVGRTTSLAGALRSQPVNCEERKGEEWSASGETLAVEEQKGGVNGETPAIEEGWETVTRGRVKSGSGAHLAGKRNSWRSYSGQSEDPSVARKASALTEVEKVGGEEGEEQRGVATKELMESETKGVAGAGKEKAVQDNGTALGEGLGQEEGGAAVGEGLEGEATVNEGEGLEGMPSADSLQEGSEQNAAVNKSDSDAEETTLCQRKMQAADKESYVCNPPYQHIQLLIVFTHACRIPGRGMMHWLPTMVREFLPPSAPLSNFFPTATESYRAEKSWADRCDSPPGGLSEIPRSPGRAIHLHQRLSSPSRKR